jgi:hypothetical protein
MISYFIVIIFLGGFYFVVSGLKIIVNGNPDNNLESHYITEEYDWVEAYRRSGETSRPYLQGRKQIKKKKRRNHQESVLPPASFWFLTWISYRPGKQR